MTASQSSATVLEPKRAAAKATVSPEEAEALLRELGLTTRQACVGVALQSWLVMIYLPMKRPRITRWLGWPVEYEIGIGQPKPFALGGRK